MTVPSPPSSGAMTRPSRGARATECAVDEGGEDQPQRAAAPEQQPDEETGPASRRERGSPRSCPRSGRSRRGGCGPFAPIVHLPPRARTPLCPSLLPASTIAVKSFIISNLDQFNEPGPLRHSSDDSSESSEMICLHAGAVAGQRPCSSDGPVTWRARWNRAPWSKGGASKYEVRFREWGSVPGCTASRGRRASPGGFATTLGESRSRPSAAPPRSRLSCRPDRERPAARGRGPRGARRADPSRAAPRLRDRRRAAGEGARRVSIPADLATCPDCLREVLRPRRPAPPLPLHQLHPLRAALHDRPRRALRPAGHDDGRLSRCARDCRREYEDPADRRFHAQPERLPGVRAARCALLGRGRARRSAVGRPDDADRGPPRPCATGGSWP